MGVKVEVKKDKTFEGVNAGMCECENNTNTITQ